MITIDKTFLEGREPEETQLLLYILLNADEDGVLCKPVREIAKESKVSYQKCRTILKKLTQGATQELTQELTQGATQEPTQGATQHLTQGITLIKVCDFDYYKGTKKKANARSNAASNARANARVNASSNARVNARANAEKSVTTVEVIKDEKIDYDKLAAFFNEQVKGTLIPQINGIKDKRRDTVKARVSIYGKKAVFDMIIKASKSDFLTGRASEFHATFDWLFGVMNFPKVLDGNYDNTNKQSHGLGKTGSAERLSDLNKLVDSLEHS